MAAVEKRLLRNFDESKFTDRCSVRARKKNRKSKNDFTITAEILARPLANFHCQYADRHMNL